MGTAGPPGRDAHGGSDDTPPAGFLPTRDALTKAWGDTVFNSLSGRARARFGAGRFVAVDAGAAVFGLPNDHYLGRCEEVRPEVEAALAVHFGVAVPLRIVVEAPDPATWSPASPIGDDPGPPDDFADLEEIRDAGASPEPPPAITSPEERLKRAFPGAEEVST